MSPRPWKLSDAGLIIPAGSWSSAEKMYSEAAASLKKVTATVGALEKEVDRTREALLKSFRSGAPRRTIMSLQLEYTRAMETWAKWSSRTDVLNEALDFSRDEFEGIRKTVGPGLRKLGARLVRRFGSGGSWRRWDGFTVDDGDSDIRIMAHYYFNGRYSGIPLSQAEFGWPGISKRRGAEEDPAGPEPYRIAGLDKHQVSSILSSGDEE